MIAELKLIVFDNEPTRFYIVGACELRFALYVNRPKFRTGNNDKGEIISLNLITQILRVLFSGSFSLFL